MVKTIPTQQKLRGGYYTPEPIAHCLAQWAIRAASDTVLEPSCGDGALLVAAAQAIMQLGATPAAIAQQIEGVEYHADEGALARQRLRQLGLPAIPEQVHISDFFAYCQANYLAEQFMGTELTPGQTFDVIIGNPPFIRYQNFPEAQQTLAFSFMQQQGFHPNRLTNAWVPFLVTAAFLLKPQGRLAFVIPAELFQVSYAAEIRRFLSKHFHRINLVTFKRLIFVDIQQEVILLLAERGGKGAAGIRVFELNDLGDLATLPQTMRHTTRVKPMDHSSEKWTQYYLSPSEIGLLRALRQHPSLTKAGDAIEVDVGVVTGQNDVFLLTAEEASRQQLPSNFLERVVSRSAHLTGAIFQEADWQANATKPIPAYLLRLPKVPLSQLPIATQHYLREAEKAELHTGYKCRIRSPWYAVPSIWIPDAFLLRQVHGYPKMVLNPAQATCTDTIHRVKFKAGQQSAIVAAFMNSLTFAFAEVTGRSYGGGVLTFEPSEMEKLPLPLINSQQLDLAEVDTCLREHGIEAVLAQTDQTLLREGLGLTAKEVTMLRGIWKKLRDRRINRK